MKKLLLITLAALSMPLYADLTFDFTTRATTRFWRTIRFDYAKYEPGVGLRIRTAKSGRLHSRQRYSAADNGFIEISVTGKIRFAKLYFRRQNEKLAEARSIRGKCGARTVTFDPATNRFWKGEIAEIRIDLLPADNQEVIIHKMVFKPRRSETSLSLPWRNTSTLAANAAKSVELPLDLRHPRILRSQSDKPLELVINFRDLYGNAIAGSAVTIAMTAGNRDYPFPVPAKAALAILQIKNPGTAPARFSLDVFQMIPQPKRNDSVTTLEQLQVSFAPDIPAVTDPATVLTPQVTVTPFRPGRNIRVLLSGNGQNIVIADEPLTAETITLPKSYLRYLTPGNYSIKVMVDGISYASNVAFTHKAPVTTKALPRTTINRDKIRPVYLINGKERAPTTEFLLADPPLDEFAYRQMFNAIAAGVPGIRLRLIFRGDNKGQRINFTEIDEAMQAALIRNPEVNLMIHVSVTDPYPGWRKNHPAEGIRDDKGNYHILNYRRTPEATSSMASIKWQEDCKTQVARLVRHMDSIPAGRRLIGILPCAGITWEWLHWGSARGVMVDYSDHYRKFYHGFLKERYNNDIAKLNQAWNSNYQSFDEITIPEPARRKVATASGLRFPAQNCPEIDHADSVSHLISGIIVDLCKVVKDTSDGRLLSGTYYGYTTYLTSAVRAHNAGHNGFVRAINSPYLDILMAPSRYAGRTIGGGGGFMFPEGSIKLRGKLAISECDIRPVGADNSSGRIDTVAGSRAIFEREYASQLAASAVLRWFDFSKGWVMAEPRLLDMVVRFNKFDEDALASDGVKTLPAEQFAVFSSERTQSYIAPNSKINERVVEFGYRQIICSGTQFAMYDITDLEAVRKSGTKVFMFLNCIFLTPQQKELIRKLAAEKGNSLLFVYGAGVIGNAKPDTAFMEEIFGCRFNVVRDNGHVIFQPQGFNAKNKLFAKTAANGAKLYFCAGPTISAQAIQQVAREAGLPIVKTDFRSPVWFGNGFISIHCANQLDAVITMPSGASKLVEYSTGKEIPAVNGKVKVRIAPATSVLYQFR